MRAGDFYEEDESVVDLVAALNASASPAVTVGPCRGWNATLDTVSPEQLFVARENAEAVRKIREWCDATDTAARTRPLSTSDSEAVFQAVAGLVEEVRRMLPEVTP